MYYLALATDYDGTIAHHGIVAPETVDALRRLKASGRKLILVSGREMNELFDTFAHSDIFDRLVLENGALVYDPATKQSRTLSPPPPPQMIAEFERRKIPCSVGRSIVATVEPYEHAVLAAIRDLGLEWHVIFNKGAVMVLPSGVNKASGLKAVLPELALPVDRVVGVGDAENDHAFLRLCGCGVAVANALPAVKAAVDYVTEGSHGDGVRELIERLLADDLAGIKPHPALHRPKGATT